MEWDIWSLEQHFIPNMGFFLVKKVFGSKILQLHKKEIEKINLNACPKVNNLKAVVNGGIWKFLWKNRFWNFSEWKKSKQPLIVSYNKKGINPFSINYNKRLWDCLFIKCKKRWWEQIEDKEENQKESKTYSKMYVKTICQKGKLKI